MEFEMKTKIVKREYLKQWKENGNKVTFYICKHCKRKIETGQPTLKLCSSKGYWDSVTECPVCKKLNFVCVYPNGKTKV